MSRENRKPGFFFRAVMIFIVAVLIIINIVLTYSANNLKKDIDSLSAELSRERLECEKLRQRLGLDMTDPENIEKEAKEQGYAHSDDMKFKADIPNA